MVKRSSNEGTSFRLRAVRFLVRRVGVSLCVLLAALACQLQSKNVTAAQAYPIGLLPSGRKVTPVGRCVVAPNFVINLCPAGNSVLSLAAGAASTQSIIALSDDRLAPQGSLVCMRSRHWSDRFRGSHILANQSLFQGIASGPGGMIYAAGGYSNNVLMLKMTDHSLKLLQKFSLRGQRFPASQYPYQYQGFGPGHPLFYPDAVAPSASGLHLFVTGLLANSLARINTRSGHIVYANAGAVPYSVAIAGVGGRRYAIVSDWGADEVTVFDAATMKKLGIVSVGPPTGPKNQLPGVHPTALGVVPGTSMVWVACTNNNRLVLVDAASQRIIRSIQDEPYSHAPAGTYPDSLAVWHTMLFAANAGNDDVAVFNRHTGKPLGLIPTGWYPTAVCVHNDALYIASAKGLGFGPNLRGQWVGNSMQSLVQRVELKDLAKHLPQWTYQALANNHFLTRQRQQLLQANAAATRFLRKHIQYAVFILRENKTFDEDFGSYARAGVWADPHLDLYNQRELPNVYALADRYALMVNYKVDGEVTAQGHQWTTAGIDSDYVQRTWPMYYSGRGLAPNPGWTQNLGPTTAPPLGRPVGFNGEDNPKSDYEDLSKLGHWSNPWISYPDGLFLFDNLAAHHVSFLDFGEFASRNEAGDISSAIKKSLVFSFPGWNRYIPDTARAKYVRKELTSRKDDFPRFCYIWLPDDHTAGRASGFYTPDAYVANNDAATGEIVQYLTHTPQWKHMAIFITEDDAQSGADHIDAHRSLALVVSPWIKPGHLVTRPYSQVDLLRTIEAICNIPSMSQWDDNARVLAGIWANQPHNAPYHAIPMQIPMTLNAGPVTALQKLRLAAGKNGHWLSPQWVKAHAQEIRQIEKHPVEWYSPTSLLKVPGPEQMRQEWIACKGSASWRHVQQYIQAMARKRHVPITDIVANDDDDGGD